MYEKDFLTSLNVVLDINPPLSPLILFRPFLFCKVLFCMSSFLFFFSQIDLRMGGGLYYVFTYRLMRNDLCKES